MFSCWCVYPTSVGLLVVVEIASADQRAGCSVPARLPLLDTLNQSLGLKKEAGKRRGGVQDHMRHDDPLLGAACHKGLRWISVVVVFFFLSFFFFMHIPKPLLPPDV